MGSRRFTFTWPVLLFLMAFAPGRASSQEEAEEALEREEPRPSGIYFQHALFYTPSPEGDPMERALAVYHESFEDRFTYRAGVVRFAPGSYVEFRLADPADYAPPGVEYLKHKGFGLTEAQRESVQESKTALLLEFFVVEPPDYEFLRDANLLTAVLAESTGGLIWDEETRELYTVEAWRAKRLAEGPAVFSNTSMHGYALPSQNYRSVTAGMRKLGLPDIALAEFPKAFWEPLSRMMRFVVYQVASQGPLKPKTRWTPDELRALLGLPAEQDVPALELIEAPRDEGDPRNDLLTVDFRPFPGESYQEKQLHALGQLFEPEGGLLDLWRERGRIMEASENAREALQAKKALFEKGEQARDRLFLKVFAGEEYLWLRLQAWEGETLTGVRVPDVTPEGRLAPAGDDPIEVKLEHVFDYLHVRADGTEEGNETSKLIRKLQGVGEAGTP